VSIEKSDKLAKVGRRHIIVDGTEIAMIGDVQRVGPEAKVMHFPAFAFDERYLKRAESLEVQ
jgi:hypothetical protein